MSVTLSPSMKAICLFFTAMFSWLFVFTRFSLIFWVGGSKWLFTLFSYLGRTWWASIYFSTNWDEKNTEKSGIDLKGSKTWGSFLKEKVNFLWLTGIDSLIASLPHPGASGLTSLKACKLLVSDSTLSVCECDALQEGFWKYTDGHLQHLSAAINSITCSCVSDLCNSAMCVFSSSPFPPSLRLRRRMTI